MHTQLDSYEHMLKESVKHFIASYPIMKGGNSGGFSSFQSIFFRLIQTMPDPPLEITWFYSAVTSHASKSASLTNPVARITLVKDLFQLLISCSKSSTGVKKIAVLAPVVYELYHIMCEFSENGLMRKEVDELVEKIVSYVSVCCDDRENVDESHIVVICIEDLVRVWTLDRVEESCKFGDNVRVFFPVLGGEVTKGVSDRCKIEELAGMVLCEVFSLRLCSKFDRGASREELLNGTRHWAIDTIKGFRNYYFLDGLFKMLLDPSLPVANLLSPENTVLLQKAVFDAVILADYVSLLSGGWLQSPEKLNRLALMWSLVADNAVQFARSIADLSTVISYINVFSNSSLINHIMLWIAPQANVEANLSQNRSTPRALIKWLFGLQDQGIRVFDDDVLEVHAKAVAGNARMDYELPHFKQHGELPQADEDELKREHELKVDEEMIDSIDGASPAAVCATITNPSNTGRKRKEGRDDMGGAKLKLAKFNSLETIMEETHEPFSQGDAVDAGKGRRTQMWF